MNLSRLMLMITALSFAVATPATTFANDGKDGDKVKELKEMKKFDMGRNKANRIRLKADIRAHKTTLKAAGVDKKEAKRMMTHNHKGEYVENNPYENLNANKRYRKNAKNYYKKRIAEVKAEAKAEAKEDKAAE